MPKMTTRGRVTIPRQIRAAYRLRAGDSVEFVMKKSQAVMIVATKRLRPNLKLRSTN